MGQNETAMVALARIDQIAEQNLMAAAGGKMTRALRIADAMQEMRQLVTQETLKKVQALQGTDLGFRTDKDKEGGYPFETLRDVVIEAAIRGYSPAGNEFNVIGGRFYATKNGLERKVREFPGLTDLKLTEGVPQTMSQGALVEYHASWKLNGNTDEIHCWQNGPSDTRIAVRVNSGMGIDAILGKAKRKMLARIYARFTGSDQGPGESEADDAPDHEIVQPVETNLDVLTRAKQEIDEAKTINEIAESLLWAEDALNDAGKMELTKYAEVARERVRASRGDRSNAKD